MIQPPKMAPRRLQLMAAQQTGLGAPTIMDRTLADQHGVAYVRFAVFAIDVDRVRAFHAEREAQASAPATDAPPFGWEVFLTEAYVLRHFDAQDPETLELIEAVCLSVLDEAPGEPRFGDQVPFAIYDGVERGALPDALRSVFHGWRAKPKPLVKDLAVLWRDETRQMRRLARLCLETPLQPPAAPPTRLSWEAMAADS